jgi:methylphosphonate synthase
MSSFLQEIITDENLVWGKSLENNPEKFFVKLTSKTINELKRNRKELTNLDESCFPELKNEINELKTKKILQGVGLLIIDGKSFLDFSKDEITKIYEMVCNILGTLYIQNINSEKIVEIKDEGKSMASGGRYHQTKEGGSYHTDSPHWTKVPDLVGLLCINQAKKGGISKFVSAYTIHNQLLKEQNDRLKTLYEKFHFDKRGEFKINESQTVFEPVFVFKNDKLYCRFLNDYIVAGHQIQNYPLSKLQETSLQSLEEISKNENNVLSCNLKPNDMIFFDNHRILHGRTEFEDYEDENRKRRLLRTWIKFDFSSTKKPELVRFGRYFLGLINDLKRRPEDAAKELNISLEYMMDILEGRKEISSEVIARAKKIWPVSSRDFFLIEDDCPNGVKIMRAEDSAKSSRIMERGGSPYYEYRDTVMSGVAPFRPEWIMELCVVNDNDPNNKSVQWNNGHFMHQFTYFVGNVNFYYIDDDGKKQTAVMKTGDSMYITPFVPHTFATRKGAKKNGLILALTYGDKLVGEVKQELASLSTELASQFSLDFSTKRNASASLIRFHRRISSLTINEVSRRTKISIEDIRKLESGNCLPSEKEITLLANALNINTRELTPNDKEEKKVIIKSYEKCERWYYPEESKTYEFTALASTSSLPFSKAFEIKVQNSSNPDYDLKAGLHQFIYNVGDSELFLNWELDDKKYNELIKPGDSVYIKPFVKHNFRGNGNLVALRIGGKIPGDSQRELSILGNRNVSRAISETRLWFNPDRK